MLSVPTGIAAIETETHRGDHRQQEEVQPGEPTLVTIHFLERAIMEG